MGRKYASLHIRDVDDRYTEKQLLHMYNRLSKVTPATDLLSGMQKLGAALGEKEVHLFNTILDTFNDVVKIKTHNSFMSIFDQELSFETVEDKALELSRELDEKVFFASVFDDDVFFFGLCQNGRSIATHASGQCEAYGIENASINVDLLEDWLSNGADIELSLNGKEGMEFEAALQKQLGFPLGEA